MDCNSYSGISLFVYNSATPLTHLAPVTFLKNSFLTITVHT